MTDLERRSYIALGKKPSKEGEMTNSDYMHLTHDESIFRNGYLKGAKKQMTLDLKKALDWLNECLPDIEYITNASAFRQNKKKFIESFKKYMQND